jgi:hypothetical protein
VSIYHGCAFTVSLYFTISTIIRLFHLLCASTLALTADPLALKVISSDSRLGGQVSLLITNHIPSPRSLSFENLGFGYWSHRKLLTGFSLIISGFDRPETRSSTPFFRLAKPLFALVCDKAVLSRVDNSWMKVEQRNLGRGHLLVFVNTHSTFNWQISIAQCENHSVV